MLCADVRARVCERGLRGTSLVRSQMVCRDQQRNKDYSQPKIALTDLITQLDIRPSFYQYVAYVHKPVIGCTYIQDK